MGVLGNLLHGTSPRIHELVCAVRDGQFESMPPRRVHGEMAIHAALKPLLAGTRGGFFVEAGANDGFHRSNTHYLEKWLGWTGLLIEAIPHRAVQCRENRPASTTVHCALVGPDYADKSVEITYFDAMSVLNAPGGALDSAEQGTRWRRFQRRTDVADGMVFHAPARTLAQVLDEFGNRPVDLLSLDVEGFELEALKGLNLRVNRPRHILVEDWDQEGVGQLLAGNGYGLAARPTEKDALYVLNE